jgi:hypothetical protein
LRGAGGRFPIEFAPGVGYRAGFQPLGFSSDRSWGCAPCWYSARRWRFAGKGKSNGKSKGRITTSVVEAIMLTATKFGAEKAQREAGLLSSFNCFNYGRIGYAAVFK